MGVPYLHLHLQLPVYLIHLGELNFMTVVTRMDARKSDCHLHSKYTIGGVL